MVGVFLLSKNTEGGFMSADSAIVFPSSAVVPVLPCPLCGSGANELAIAEAGIERRFGMPVLPVSDYSQACCHNCGLLYINASVDQNYLVKLYSNETIEWAAKLTGSAEGAMNDDERARFAEVVDIVARHRDVRGVQWLDFGCQTGELGEAAMVKHGAVMSGVEVSEDYAMRAARLWGRDRNAVQPSIDGHQGKRFDVISSLETLEHLAKPWNMVSNFRNSLQRDGLLVLSVPCSHYFRLKYHVFRLMRAVTSRRALRERAQSERRSLFGLCHTHLYNFTPKSLSLLLEKEGYDAIYVGGIGWSRRMRLFQTIARVIEVVTFGRLVIFPSVIAVAKVKR
jgi:2-polyprenyl-3-methyl-5-hydroxy-6-metoxy-1,4-benzoquinol methylase